MGEAAVHTPGIVGVGGRYAPRGVCSIVELAVGRKAKNAGKVKQ